MLILHGRYFWRRKVLAFRNDFCLKCEAPRVAFQDRTFDVFHLYWVPILPLGFWRRWRCAACGSDPHANPRTRTGFKWTGVVLLAFIAAVLWTPGATTWRDDAMVVWGMRIAGLAGTAWAIWAAIKSPAPIRLRDRLPAVLPNQSTECPLCGAPLVESEKGWGCLHCRIERKVLRAD